LAALALTLRAPALRSAMVPEAMSPSDQTWPEVLTAARRIHFDPVSDPLFGQSDPLAHPPQHPRAD